MTELPSNYFNKKINSSWKFGFSKQQKKTILEQYFNEDVNNINHLSNSADMYLIKPYFEYLCNNSYDDDCNNYRKYLNINLKENSNHDEISEQIVEQVRAYANKFHSLSVNDQFIEKIRKMLANKNQLSKEDFDAFSKYMEGFLKESGMKQFQDDIQDLDKQTQDIDAEYKAKVKELESISKKINDKIVLKDKEITKKTEQIEKEQDEIKKLETELKEAQIAEDTELMTSISFRIKDKEKRMDEYTRERGAFENEKADLSRESEIKYKEIESKKYKLKEMQEKDREELEKRKQKKYKENGESIFIKILRDKKIWKKYPTEKELKTLIENPEKSINFFKKFTKLDSISPIVGGAVSDVDIVEDGLEDVVSENYNIEYKQSKEKLELLLHGLKFVESRASTERDKNDIKDVINKVERDIEKIHTQKDRTLLSKEELVTALEAAKAKAKAAEAVATAKTKAVEELAEAGAGALAEAMTEAKAEEEEATKALTKAKAEEEKAAKALADAEAKADADAALAKAKADADAVLAAVEAKAAKAVAAAEALAETEAVKAKAAEETLAKAEADADAVLAAAETEAAEAKAAAETEAAKAKAAEEALAKAKADAAKAVAKAAADAEAAAKAAAETEAAAKAAAADAALAEAKALAETEAAAKEHA